MVSFELDSLACHSVVKNYFLWCQVGKRIGLEVLSVGKFMVVIHPWHSHYVIKTPISNPKIRIKEVKSESTLFLPILPFLSPPVITT